MSDATSDTSVPTLPVVPSVKLANGVAMPMVASGCAFGNWTGDTKFQGFLPEQAWKSTAMALRVGVRSFDGAHVYCTERQVGNVLGRSFADGSLAREDVFLTSKFAHPPLGPNVAVTHLRTWNPRDVPSVSQRIRDDMQKSLDDVGVGYFDLVLVHWPGCGSEKDAEYARKVRAEMWGVLEGFLELGTARAIGVANFAQKHLEELFEDCVVRPMVNQIEVHPYCQQTQLVKFCSDNKIVVQAYAPFASGAFGMLKDEVVVKIAEQVSRSVGQVILRWHIQKGRVVLPKSTNEARMRSNLELFDFELSEEQMAAIDAMAPEEPKRTCPDPATIA